MNSKTIEIVWERRAVRELRGLVPAGQARILDAVEMLRDDPHRGKRLSGEWKGLRRLRVRGYRVIYGFDGARLLVSVVVSVDGFLRGM